MARISEHRSPTARGAKAFAAVLLAASAATAGVLPTVAAASASTTPAPLESPLAAVTQRQIAAIQADKASRTPAEQKVDSNLLYAIHEADDGVAVAGAPSLESGIQPDRHGGVGVDIEATVGSALLDRIAELGGSIESSIPRFDSIRARLPLAAVVALAADPAVRDVAPAEQATTESAPPTADEPTTDAGTAAGPTPATGSASGTGATTDSVGSGSSQADTTVGANVSRASVGVDGDGVKVCAISNGIASIAARQATGDLPAAIDVLPGQAGAGDEGTAMLELIHDIAPAAELGFATGNGGEANMAQNILDLAADGCDIITDDITYPVERTFKDSAISQAITTVRQAGVPTFSSASNAGNVGDNTAGSWQGNFSDGGAAVAPFPTSSHIHQWAPGVTQNTISGTPNAGTNLEWSDPPGASTNDYDLYITNSSGTIVASSTNVQNGTQNPQETTPSAYTVAGNKVVVLKAAAAASRYLLFNTNRARLAVATGGAARGHHNSIDAIGVAATPSATAFDGASPTGPYPGQHTTANLSERFSSDGPVRKFFNNDNTPITPGNFSSTGGVGYNGPDITSADGNTTTTPGFIPFYGTSAAAPDAAAIAALALQAKPTLTPSQLETAMEASALDIEGAGLDTVAGHGIVMVPALMATLGATAKANLTAATRTLTVSAGNANGQFDPGETIDIAQALKNTGLAGATGVSATLSSPTADATVLTPTVAYPDIAAGATASASDGPLRFRISHSCACGRVIPLTLTLNYGNGFSTSRAISIPVTVGAPGPVTDVAYSGSTVAIPDDSLTGGSATVTVGNIGLVAGVTFSIDGTACSSTTGSTTVGVAHTYTGDLVGTLKAPNGTTVTLFTGVGGAGVNFCQTVFSDGAATSIQTKTTATDSPFVGTFKPFQALSAFNGVDPQGAWTFKVADVFSGGDTGVIRAFSLHVQTANCTPYAGANTAPVAVDDTYRVARDHALTTSAAKGVVHNDTDADTDPLTAAKVANPSHGTVTVNANGGFTYTPTAGYTGPDSFTYQANDGVADSNIATVHLTVQTPTQVYVERVFLDFVGRLADSGGLSFWSGRLDTGKETRASFAKQMSRSHEYATKVVVRAYQDVLARSTDPSGREYWANKVQGGMPVSSLVLELMGSNEFLTKSGGTVTGFVNAAFQAILARQPTSAERTSRVNAINGGTTRRKVALDLYNTTESKRRRTKVQFQLLLLRLPTTAEYSTWSTNLTTKSDIDLAIALAATNEYFTNAQNLSG